MTAKEAAAAYLADLAARKFNVRWIGPDPTKGRHRGFAVRKLIQSLERFVPKPEELIACVGGSDLNSTVDSMAFHHARMLRDKFVEGARNQKLDAGDADYWEIVRAAG